MQRNESTALRDEIQQRFLLLWRNPGPVGVEHQTIVSGEFGGIEIVQRLGVVELDSVAAQHRLNLLEAIRGPMMAVVTEEQDTQGNGIRGSGHRGEPCREQTGADDGQATEQRRNFHCTLWLICNSSPALSQACRTHHRALGHCHWSAGLRHGIIARSSAENAGSETGAPPAEHAVRGSVKKMRDAHRSEVVTRVNFFGARQLGP